MTEPTWLHEHFEKAGSSIGFRVTCSSMSHCTAFSTPGWRSTSRSVPQSPPPMITTRLGSAWVNSAGCDIISW